MIDYVLETAISNTIFASLLAMIAFAIGRQSGPSRLTHVLWILVFLKLATPPVVNIPVTLFAPVEPTIELPDNQPVDYMTDGFVDARITWDTAENFAPKSQASESSSFPWSAVKIILGAIWLLGCTYILVLGILRVFRFNRTIALHHRQAPLDVQQSVDSVAKQLQVSENTELVIVDARISPMIWWVGGRVKMIVPKWIISELAEPQWRMVVAHEFAHVVRKDYWVRWLEWFVCTLFWWNPLSWWAQKNLRAVEEICCDSLVLERLNPQPQAYANSILQAVESLVCPEFRPPAIASQINSGGFLERRFEMILSASHHHRPWLGYTIAAILVLVLAPLGLVRAQDFEKIEKKLERMVEKDQLEAEHAEVMLHALHELLEGEEDGDRHFENDEDHDWPKARHLEKHVWEIEQGIEHDARQIEKAVKAGKLSKREAHEKLESLHHEAHMQIQALKEEWNDKRHRDPRHHDERFVEDNVEHHFWDHERDDLMEDMRHREEEMHALERHLHEAIEHKKHVEEQAKRDIKLLSKQIHELREHLEQLHSQKSQIDAEGEIKRKIRFQNAAEKIKHAVDQGDISEEEAEKKIIEVRRKLFSPKHASFPRRQNERLDLQLEHLVAALVERTGDSDLAERIAQKIRHGDVSKREMHRHLEQRLHHTQQKMDQIRAVEADIRAAVEAGALSPEQADEKRAAIRRKFDQNLHHQHDSDHNHEYEDDHDDEHGDDAEHDHDHGHRNN